MKSTFSIIFYLKRQVVKKDGTVPVMGRITVDGTQAQFSCKVTANPDLWDTKGGRMKGKSAMALEETANWTRCACASTRIIKRSWTETVLSLRKR